MSADQHHPPPDSLPPTDISPVETGPDDRIGHYRILRKLGEGAMGEVYEAEQQEPVRRRVALKLVKAGMDTRQVVARFESERQALALMDHPNISRVYEAGATDRGRPYFAMEYVKGVPINQYCDTNRLGMRERLALFVQVCDGIQHAHHKGVIHRDIKPTNVLVGIQDDRPVPKIIDFGVAKAVAQPLTERTLHTELGQVIGTPEYMSPEQAEMTGLDIDTRTDVYSLGVLLYELLVGALPFEPRELRRNDLVEIRRKIREDEPSYPSTRLTTLGDAATESARRRRTNLHALRKELSGDLDWITMRALEKDRTRRYASPHELAADIERHLMDQPVLAGPPSRVYRMGKFIRRHSVGVAGILLVILALLGGSAVATYGLISARRDAATAEHMVDFLIGLFEVADPSEARGNSITAREILDTGATRIEQDLADQPRVQARLMTTIGEVYQGLGLHGQAEPLLFSALEARRRVLGETHPETLESLHGIAWLFYKRGKLKEAEPYLREALEGRRRVLGDDHADTLRSVNNMGVLLDVQGRLEEAEPFYAEALEGRRRLLGEDHPHTLGSMDNMGSLLRARGRLEEAEPYVRRSLEGFRRVSGDNHPSTLITMDNLGTLLHVQGKLDEAAIYLTEALASRRQVLGDDHPDTLATIDNLGSLRLAQGRPEEAGLLFSESLNRSRRVLSVGHVQISYPLVNLGRLRISQQRFDDAEAFLRESLAIRREALPEGHWLIAQVMTLLGESLLGQGRFEEAEPLMIEGYDGMEMSPEVSGERKREAIANISRLYETWGRPDQAAAWRERAVR